MGTPCTHTHNERAAAPNGESGCRRPRDDAGSHGGPSGPAPERSFAHPTGPARPTPRRRAGYYRASQGREASGRSHGGVGETPAPGRSPGEGRWTGLLVAVRPALCPRLSRRNPLRSRARPTSAGAMTAPACGPAGAPAKVTPALVRSRSRGQPGPSEAKALLGCRGPEGGPSQAGGALPGAICLCLHCPARPSSTETPLKPPFREQLVSQSSASPAGHLPQTVRGSLFLQSFRREPQTPGRCARAAAVPPALSRRGGARGPPPNASPLSLRSSPDSWIQTIPIRWNKEQLTGPGTY